MRNEILVGHVLDKIPEIPDNSIHTILTSSPYWGKRDYGIPDVVFPTSESEYKCEKLNVEHEWEEAEKQPTKFGKDGNTDEKHIWTKERKTINNTSYFCKQCFSWLGQLGLEPSPQLFVDHLIQVFELLKPKLVDYGSLWVNLGDTYHGGNLTYKQKDGDYLEAKNRKEKFGKSDYNQSLLDNFVQLRNKYTQINKQSKALIPHLFATKMVYEKGWLCRNEILWYKTNPKPESVKTRFTTDRENMWWFTKSPKYYFVQQFEKLKSVEKITSWTGSANRQALSKFNSIEEERYYRSGLHKDRGKKMVRKRDLPEKGEFVKFLKSVFVKDELINKSGIKKTTIDHWYRGDSNTLPSIEHWQIVQKAFGIKSYPELINYKLVPDQVKTSKKGMRNMRETWSDPTLNLPYWVHEFLKDKMNDFSRWLLARNIPIQDVWKIQIPTSGKKRKQYSKKHYAIYPKELIKIPIQATCPKLVCSKCNTPKEWNCECNEEYLSGIVLDPFAGCYDEKTEVLTKNGFIPFSEVTKVTELATEDLEGNLIYTRPISVFNYFYEGEMYKFETNFVDILVTPNHRMYACGRHKRWRFYLPEDIKSNFKLRRNTRWIDGNYNTKFFEIGDKKIPINDWIRFYGIWLADGHVNHSGRGYKIALTQKKYTSDFRKIISILPYNWKEYDKGNDCISFRTFDKDLHKYLKQHGKTKEKYIDRFVLSLSSDKINLFLNSFGLGDGSLRKHGSRIFYTSSKRLANDLQEAIFKIGNASSITKRERKSIYSKTLKRTIKSHETYHISESITALTPKFRGQALNLKDGERKAQRTIIQYSGMVYCAEILPSHLLYIRRNGKAVWCGNSGTTMEVALELQRDWLAIEIKPEYIQNIQDRIDMMDEGWSEKFI
ncbi:MAG: DNA methyltransferase [Patescibacteria group bacterium]|nr:DNA methyltransferase [Patescibacteria group bacterium]